MSEDIFATIAGRGIGRDRLAELEAVPPFVPFDGSVPVWRAQGDEDSDGDTAGGARAGAAGAAWEPLPVIADAAALEPELARWRAWAAPFLQRLGTPLPVTRQAVELVEFDWKQVAPEEESGFAAALAGGVDGWQRVRLPHYGGPTGRALAWYRGQVELPEAMLAEGRSLWICFGGADYKARVTVNGRCVGEHEGFFSAFEFDISRVARAGRNDVFIELWNDGICMGYQDEPDGEKLYAATGLGWDEPGSGWHHCPPGMGIWRKISIESRTAVFIRDLWVRPLEDLEHAEVRIEIYNCAAQPREVRLQLSIEPENFSRESRESAESIELKESIVAVAGSGATLVRRMVALAGARRWTPEAPWLYRAAVALYPAAPAAPSAQAAADALPADAQAATFGMRLLRMDEAAEPKGRLFLNDRPVRLRGANTMGFEQQRVMAGDLAGLTEDLLLAKAANMNFLRFTQRPVEREVYDLCDRLGIMAQSDLPLFGHLRRTQFSEAVRQAVEMARHTRRHACNVILSFINEPFPLSWGDKRDRQLDRTELEGFCTAAALAIRVEDPDITIKPVDGDYDPPTPFGLPDSHIYTLWYNGHGLPFGQLHQGAFPPTKANWCFGCGEFGAEGLDYPDLMQRRYPADWLPQPGEAPGAWSPQRICRAQSAQMQPLLYDLPKTFEQWCAVSQEYQRRATKDLTEALRRMDRLVSCAIHLFIDAFPAGWMKTIVDCERRPKPAFFALRDAYAPVLITPRSDRRFYTSGETVACDVWVCNDHADAVPGCTVRWKIEGVDGAVFAVGSEPVDLPPCAPRCAGIVHWQVPSVDARTRFTLRIALCDPTGKALAQGELGLEAFPQAVETSPVECVLLDGCATPAGMLAVELGMRIRHAEVPDPDDRLVIASAWPEEGATAAAWVDWVAEGGTLVLYDLKPGSIALPEGQLEIKQSGFAPAIFVSQATGHPMVAGFEADDFRYWYDTSVRRIEPFLSTAILPTANARAILATGYCQWGKPSVPAHAATEILHGKGILRICQLQLIGRTRANPPADLFARRLLAVNTDLAGAAQTDKDLASASA